MYNRVIVNQPREWGMAPRKLSAKQQRFVEEYVIDLNATAAAKRAGYSDRTARAQSSRLLTKADIQACVQAERQRIAERNDVTVDRIVEEYRRIAFADLTEVIQIRDGHASVIDTDDLTIEQKAAISEIHETKDGIRIKRESKIAALDSLGKHLGMFTKNINVHNTGPPPTIVLDFADDDDEPAHG